MVENLFRERIEIMELTQEQVLDCAKQLEDYCILLRKRAIEVVRFWESHDGKHRFAGIGYNEYVDVFARGECRYDKDGYALVVEHQGGNEVYVIPWLAVTNFEVYKTRWLKDFAIERAKHEHEKMLHDSAKMEAMRLEYERLKKIFEKDEKSA